MEAVPADGARQGSRVATHVVGLGAGFGVLGDVLFHDSAVGLNAVLWIGTLAVAGWQAQRRSSRPAEALPVLLATGTFFAACLAWRASPFLRFWDVAAVAAVVVTIAVQLRGALRSAHIIDYGRGVLDVAGDLAAGPIPLAAAAPWSVSGGARRRAAAIATGLVLAVPVLLVFGSLLAAADPAMEAFVRGLFAWDLETVVTHLVTFGVTAWLAVGGLWRLVLARAERVDSPSAPWKTFGSVELGIPLGGLALLLAVFIGLQTRYLFGGEPFVRSTGITYAEFARRGFFELVACCALVLPVLVGARHLVDRRVRTSVEGFRALAATIPVLVGLVMVSAFARMRLYVGMYGLTEDRVYATAFMFWLGAGLVWFVLTEFGDRVERFATGAVAAGFVLLAGLNAVNPDAVIARVNLGRSASRVELDVGYLARLSTDALPTLAARWPTLDRAARCALRTAVERASRDRGDWREWTWSAWRATRSARTVSLPGRCDAD